MSEVLLGLPGLVGFVALIVYLLQRNQDRARVDGRRFADVPIWEDRSESQEPVYRVVARTGPRERTVEMRLVGARHGSRKFDEWLDAVAEDVRRTVVPFTLSPIGVVAYRDTIEDAEHAADDLAVALAERLPVDVDVVVERWNRWLRVWQDVRLPGRDADALATGGWLFEAQFEEEDDARACATRLRYEGHVATGWRGRVAFVAVPDDSAASMLAERLREEGPVDERVVRLNPVRRLLLYRWRLYDRRMQGRKGGYLEYRLSDGG
jgi:hypothetical protein